MILSILIETPDLTNKQLSEVTGLAKSTVSQQIQSLLDSMIVRESFSSGTGTTYSVRAPSMVSAALSKSGHNIMSEAAERFADLWDF
jgi:predicted HTH transcriptional regulator